jgi:DNA recombination protein RmuC
MQTLLIILIALAILNIILGVVFKAKPNSQNQELILKIDSLDKSLQKIESNLKEDFKINREENANLAKDNRAELNNTLKDLKKELTDTLREINEKAQSDNTKMRDSVVNSFKSFEESFDKNVRSFNDLQRDKFNELNEKQNKLVEGTEKKLESIRVTVEEKLEKTLSERLGQSFETVGKQLIEVQKGLGEMQNLAQDVGGLKKVLSNVKMRGGIGEVQLAMLLEQVLAPEQYQANVKTKEGSSDLVEFAIKLPGRDEANSCVWLPVDAKFPKDVYEQLQTAYEIGDLPAIETAQKNLESTIKKMAKDIHDKYIDPPNTTDFGIMFLPFEGIYAEVVRKASLLEDLQRNYKIIVTGPTTLAAILNSLQMGFKTLAIQKRSGEVWKVLGAVKKEFENFGGLMQKAQGNIQTGLNQLDDMIGKRSRAIQRTLKNIETATQADTNLILPESDDVNENV